MVSKKAYRASKNNLKNFQIVPQLFLKFETKVDQERLNFDFDLNLVSN
jgi:hypothetical protein